MTLYLDLDGVFADFDAHVKATFGKLPAELGDQEMWARLRETDGFYRGVPLMRGADRMWTQFAIYKRVFLTGIPRPERKMAFAAQEKILWVAHYYGKDVGVITCLASDKAKFCQPGDVLLDDRTQYAHLWRDAGGIFIHHNPADVGRSITLVREAIDAQSGGHSLHPGRGA